MENPPCPPCRPRLPGIKDLQARKRRKAIGAAIVTPVLLIGVLAGLRPCARPPDSGLAACTSLSGARPSLPPTIRRSAPSSQVHAGRTQARRLRPDPARADADQRPARLDARRGHYVHGNAVRAVRRPPPYHPHRPARRTVLRPAVLQLTIGPPRARQPVHSRDGQPDRRVQASRDRCPAAGWRPDHR